LSLHRAGIRPHPCEPWTSLVPSVASNLLPGGNDASLPVLRRRLALLEGWKPAREWKPSESMGLQQRVADGQGKAAAQSLGQILSGVAPVVLTGQQPGVAGGPLFVWLKAHTAIVHAERMSAKLALPVRALFWVAGDDSDLSEVRYLSDSVTGALLDSHPGEAGERKPVGDLPFPDPMGLTNWVDKNWPQSGLHSILDRKPTDLSSLMVACLRHWFGDRLVVVDARWPELRLLAHRTYRTFGRSPEGIHKALAAGMTAASAAGLNVAIRSWPDKLRLFRIGDDNSRRRISVADGVLSDGEGWTLSVKSLPSTLDREPERFSHDVVSRPFAAEEIFPVAAHVLGPGEYAYFACMGLLSQKIGAPLAPALPRASCTILPSGPWETARIAGWEPPVRASGPWDPLKKAFLQAKHPEERLWVKTWGDARADYLEQLAGSETEPALESLGRKLAAFEKRLHHNRLNSLAFDHSRELADLKRLWHLTGSGALQERSVSPWALEHHLGQPDLLRRLAEEMDPDEPVHVVWEAK
jgi:hypothetical protein